MTGEPEGSLAQACAELAHTMARPDAAERVLPEIAHQVSGILGVGAAAVVSADADGHLHVAPDDDPLATLVAREQQLAEGPTLAALSTDATTSAHTLLDVATTWPAWVREARRHDIGAWLSVPSSSEGRTVVLSAASTRPHHWTECEVTSVGVLADLASGWVAHADELDRVRRTADQLQEALDRRLVIEQAKGILAGELGCTLEHSFDLLRRHARRNSVTVRSVAQAVVNLGLRPPDVHGPEGTPQP